VKTACRFAYAQARIHARYACLPTDADWERLAGARGLAGFFEEARNGALRNWVKPFSGLSDSHDIEAGLRAFYREHVAEVVAWVPRPWQAAFRWTRWLVLIPLFDHLARGEAMPAWVSRDHGLHRLFDGKGDLNTARLRRAGVSSLLVSDGDPAAAWLLEWRQRWPRCRPVYLRNLALLEILLARHLAEFRRASPETTWALRYRLREHLGLLFHQRLLQPAGVFIYLILVLLDLEHLRSELVGRALFAASEAT